MNSFYAQRAAEIGQDDDSTVLPLKEIRDVNFSVLSSSQVRNMSVCEVTKEICCGSGKDRNIPVDGGLADPRMGPLHATGICVTCKEPQRNCMGHFGHIELNAPCYAHPFTKTVAKVLKCVCSNCSSFLLDHRLREKTDEENELYAIKVEQDAVDFLLSQAGFEASETASSSSKKPRRKTSKSSLQNAGSSKKLASGRKSKKAVKFDMPLPLQNEIKNEVKREIIIKEENMDYNHIKEEIRGENMIKQEIRDEIIKTEIPEQHSTMVKQENDEIVPIKQENNYEAVPVKQEMVPESEEEFDEEEQRLEKGIGEIVKRDAGAILRQVLNIKDPKRRLNALVKLVPAGSVCKNCRSIKKTTRDHTGELEVEEVECGQVQPFYSVSDGVIKKREKKRKRDENFEEKSNAMIRLSAKEAYDILSRINAVDAERLGFSKDSSLGITRPEDLILTVLPVAPLTVRPPVFFGAARSDDDLTVKYADIIRCNNMLDKATSKGHSKKMISDMEKLLQYHVSTFVASDIPGVARPLTKTKKPIKAIQDRLKGKEGRIRGNLMGKRVDFSARSVITGDPNLAIDQLGVPKTIAMNMTFPEIVTPYNEKWLKKLVINGPNQWPGAKYVTKKNSGCRTDLRFCRKRGYIKLEPGDKVERMMKDDDLVLFNRQPSLHKLSMMGHRAKVLQYSTFRMNLSVTAPYNADFDGDEMNLHLPQNYEAKSEIKNLMLTPLQVINPASNRPCMGVVQDALLAASLLSKRDTFLTRDEVMDCLMQIPISWHAKCDSQIPAPAIIKSKRGPLWTGKQVVSILIPRATNYSRKTNIGNLLKKVDGYDYFPSDEWFCNVRNGEFLFGVLDKKSIGATSNGLIHVIFKEKGVKSTQTFIDEMQFLCNHWLTHHGFTIGIKDTVTDMGGAKSGCLDGFFNGKTRTDREIDNIVADAYCDVQRSVDAANSGQLRCQPGKKIRSTFEGKVNGILNHARDRAGQRVAENVHAKPVQNNMVSMILAGSKGSWINLAQVMAFVGQQNVEGQRISNGFEGRALPHFLKDDLLAEPHGFVKRSYVSGLGPAELYD